MTSDGAHAAAHLGSAVAGAGDLDGNGASDVLVGADGFENGQTQEGGAFAFLGSRSGLAPLASWSYEGDQVGAHLGAAVASAGDVNGDGFDDLAVGAPNHDGLALDEGRALCFLGSATGPGALPAWSVAGDLAGDELGRALAPAGDVNGDGYADVVLGLPGAAAGAGEARLFLGNSGRGGHLHALRQSNPDGTPLALGGRTQRDGHFRLEAEFERDAAGGSWAWPTAPSAWLEWEVKPLDVPFDGSGLERGPAQALEPAGGRVTLSGLASCPVERGHARPAGPQSFHWRARVATNHPLFPHGPWSGLQASAPSTSQLRRAGTRAP